MGYENNHYVPQLILRRYGDKINRFDLETGKLYLSGSIKNAYVCKNLYGEELEKEIGKLESLFANLIDKKILNEDAEIRLQRQEINLIKKFLVIGQLRVPSSLNLPFEEKEENYLNSGFKEVKKENEKYEEYIKRTIKVILDSKEYADVLNHLEVTYQACKWWKLYESCYLTIWDGSKCGEDFIITDIGMSCEHESSKFLPGNDELIKLSYMANKILENKNNIKKRNFYSHLLLGKMVFVQANFYMFPTSSTKMIGLVNPFFRLYGNNSVDNLDELPNVWPSKLKNKEILKPNNVIYTTEGKHSDDDVYIYKVKSLQLEDVIYINCLMLDRVAKLFGFLETSKVSKSLVTYLALGNKSRNQYQKLKEELIKNGYDLPREKNYKDLADGFKCNFNLLEVAKQQKIIEDFTDYFKNVKM